MGSGAWLLQFSGPVLQIRDKMMNADDDFDAADEC